MRLLWLADCLRGAGLNVREVEGWKTRGSDSYGPVRGVTIHETRGSVSSTDAGEIRVLLNGSNTAPPPIAQLYLSRSGEWHVVASGTCFHNKTGWGGPNQGLGNDSLLGIEAQHAEAEDWAAKPVQYASYVRGVAALIARGGWPVSRVAGHREHQPGDKPDPEFDMDQFRSDVAAALAGDDMEQTDELAYPTPNAPGRRVGQALTDVSQLRDWLIGAGEVAPGAVGYPQPDSPAWNLAHLPELLAKHAGAPVDVTALTAQLKAALRPELDAAAERAIRRALGTLDGAVPPVA